MFKSPSLFALYFCVAGMIVLPMGSANAKVNAVWRVNDSIDFDTKASIVDSIDVSSVADAPITDSLSIRKFFSGAEIKVDYGKLLLLWTEFESKYEIGVNFRFYERIVFSSEFGQSELNPLKAYEDAIFYTVSGVYGRVGFDYYTAYDPGNFYYAGFRYCMSNFQDEGKFADDSGFLTDYPNGFGSNDATAAWMELVLGTETYLKISKQSKESGQSRFLFGWNARLRFLTSFKQREELRIYSIPGYGRTFNDITIALNLYIKYRIGQ
jgi:hypothetical protein